jgi:8-oxo-dGTP pyrophosphatase MutT (NUDIX family)
MPRVVAAGMFLVNKDNKILVGHPTHHKPEFWSIPKGKVDEGETLLEAAIRETYEESNVSLEFNEQQFTQLHKRIYNHKKKEITSFVRVEMEDENWGEWEVKCNSNVPEERGGFPEMDDYKWVSVEEARNILHNTQVASLDEVKIVINKIRKR